MIRGFRDRARSVSRTRNFLIGISVASFYLFLGFTVDPAIIVPRITIEAAREWNAYVAAGNATALAFPESRIKDTRQPPAPVSDAGNLSDPSRLLQLQGEAIEDLVIADLPVDDEESLQMQPVASAWFPDTQPLDQMDADLALAAFDATLRALRPSRRELRTPGALSTVDQELELAEFARTLNMPPDSLDIPPSDSTTRARFLSSRRSQSAVSEPFPPRSSAFYLSSTKGVEHVVEFDSTRNIVRIRETVNGHDVRVPYEMTLEEYIQGRYNFEREKRSAAKAAEYSKGGDDLTNLLKNITEIDIPVAPNPLMSIFGDRSRISVRINGAIDINAGFRIESSDQQSVFLRPTQFSPNFKQQVQISVNGMVGDKLSIQADWSTERTFDYENQLKIKYTGYEDEIIQSVEAGNVSLQTPSTLIQGSGALFGLKAEFQIGPLHLATIASQKKGESSRLTVTGGSQESDFERHAYEYSDNHYWVDIAYREPDNENRNVYEAYYNYRSKEYGNASAPIQLRPDLYIKEIEVWVSRPSTSGGVTDPEERDAVATIVNPTAYTPSDPSFPPDYDQYLDPNATITQKSGEIEFGKFKRLKKDVDYTYNPVTGIITLNQTIQEDQILAAAYRIDGTSLDQIFGTFAGDDRLNQKKYYDANNVELPPRLLLKLIKPKNLGPSFTTAWKLKVRSIYSLNTRNLKAEDLADFKLIFREGGQPDYEILTDINVNLLRLFGLDYTNDVGGGPDGKIDFLPGETVNPTRGELIFPTLEPWNEGMKILYANMKPGANQSDVEKYQYPEVYTQTKTQARLSLKDKIIITGKTRGASTAVYNLGFNVVAGSVRVYLDGRELTAGSDYQVDENIGSVRITNEAALVPGANLAIDYEKQDLFSFASKTLIGARGDLDLGERSFLGFTWMSLNQKTLSDKVRIGEEPLSNQMLGFDGRTDLDLPVLTDALNTLPFIRTNEKSSLNLQGEMAMILPEPNTKLSTIPSDNGEGIAYIDDFEGSRVFIPLQTAYSVWRLGSIPPALPDNNAPNDSIMHTYRGKFDWYNVPVTAFSDKTVTVSEIWPEKSVAREDQRVTVLDLDFYPGEYGQFNYTPNLKENPRKNWGGMVRLLPVNATNLVDGNFNYIEIWMKVENYTGQTGKMLLDLGKLSEEVIPTPPNKLHSEDDVIPGSIRNGILNAGEDVGLDMLTNAEEQVAYANEILTYGLDPNDPSRDNFAYNSADWSKFNGTEGNINDPAGQFPDTEDLNNNSVLDLTNDFFRYEISLDASRFDPADPTQKNPYVVGGGTNGWYQFRIPLNDDTRTLFGTPALDNVEYMRLILTGFENDNGGTPINVRIADFNFVGNQWYEIERSNPHFTVAVVNVEDNPEYTSPPGVIRPRDRTRPDQEIYGNEQSLSLDFTDLPADSALGAYRVFSGAALDLFNYRQFKMYVHGDPYLTADDYELVMRFGTDSASYYEYRTPIKPGWDTENEVSINFADLTAIKGLKDSSSVDTDFPVPGKPGAYFWMVGNPSVVGVERIAVSIRNKSNRSITGRVWINELRVIEPNTRNGYAYNASANLRLADIANVSANVNHRDPFFHGLSERFSASRSDVTNWNLSTTLNIDRLFPESWKGTQVNVTYSHSENLTKPLLVPNIPDVEVEAYLNALAEQLRRQGASEQEIDNKVRDARIATQSLIVRDSWAFPTVRFKMPGEFWLIQDVFNRLDFSYNYSIIRERNEQFQSIRDWQWQARVGYGYDFGRDGYVMPFRALFRSVPLLSAYADAKWYAVSPARRNHTRGPSDTAGEPTLPGRFPSRAC